MKQIILILALVWGVMGYQVPVGIPNPADSMGFDPLNIPRPDPAVKCTSWANGNVHSKAAGDDCDCYYVDKDHPSATDASNPYGNPTKPRLTIPTAVVIKNNSYVEIHGGGNSYEQTFRIYKDNGSPDSLVWFVGKDNPVINNFIDIGFGTNYDSINYVIFDGLNLTYTKGADIRPRYAGHHFSNIVIRNCTMSGTGTTSDASGVYIGPSTAIFDGSVKNIVIYNCKIYGFGVKSNPGEECLIYNTAKSTNTWVLSNELYDAAEDAIAGGHSGQHTIVGYYIGDNYIHRNQVNGIDLKQVYNLVISSNIIKNHMAGNGGSGPAQAVVLHYSGNTTPPGVWRNWPYYASVINNIIDSTREGVVTSDVTNLLVYGNVFRHIMHDSLYEYLPQSAFSKGAAIMLRGIKGNCIIEKNTITKTDAGIKCPDEIFNYNLETTYYKTSFVRFNNAKYMCIEDNNDSGIVGIDPSNTQYWKLCTLSIKNNLVLSGNEADDCDLQFASINHGSLFEIDNNNFWSSGDTSKIRWGSSYWNLSNFQANTGKCANCLETDPLTVSDTNLRLTSSSPMRGAGVRGFATDWHHMLYNLYLNVDIDSTAIPQGTDYDIGAFQYNAGYTPPVEATQFTITVNTVGEGAVAQSPSGSTHDSGTVIIFTATPAEGWSFTGYTDSLVSSDSIDSIVLNSNKIVTATFTEDVILIPTIGTQPINDTTVNGGSASFTVSVSGTEPLSYKWTLAGDSIGTTNTLNLSNVTLGMSGNYYKCVVTNEFGSVTSDSALLIVEEVRIDSIRPSPWYRNRAVSIYGKWFGSSQGSDSVLVGGINNHRASLWSNTQIVDTLPDTVGVFQVHVKGASQSLRILKPRAR